MNVIFAYLSFHFFSLEIRFDRYFKHNLKENIFVDQNKNTIPLPGL